MRCSACISRRQAGRLRDAFHRARTLPELQQHPLNLYVVLNFDHVEPWDFADAFQALRRNHFTRWLRHHTGGRVRPYYIWCLEHVSRPGVGANFHANFVVHVPRPLQRAFRANLPLWLAHASGVVHVAADAINVQPIKEQRGGLVGLQRYLLKGVDPAIAARYRVNPEPQGEIIGKRVGISETLGPAACERSLRSVTSRVAA